CAGGDVDAKNKDANLSDLAAENIGALNKVILKIRDIKKPVIASIRGNASGAGFSLVPEN
ncbi:MAG: hypothetical protein R6W68_15495, partial [Ignavibacteriaceae bacterium]